MKRNNGIPRIPVKLVIRSKYTYILYCNLSRVKFFFWTRIIQDIFFIRSFILSETPHVNCIRSDKTFHCLQQRKRNNFKVSFFSIFSVTLSLTPTFWIFYQILFFRSCIFIRFFSSCNWNPLLDCSVLLYYHLSILYFSLYKCDTYVAISTKDNHISHFWLTRLLSNKYLLWSPQI